VSNIVFATVFCKASDKDFLSETLEYVTSLGIGWKPEITCKPTLHNIEPRLQVTQMYREEYLDAMWNTLPLIVDKGFHVHIHRA